MAEERAGDRAGDAHGHEGKRQTLLARMQAGRDEPPDLEQHVRRCQQRSAFCIVPAASFSSLLVYPAASDDDVLVVEDDRLTGGDGGLRRVEDELRPVRVERADAS